MPVIPATRLPKARGSSSVLGNSTHEALIRNSRWATSPRRGPLGAGEQDRDDVEVGHADPPVDGDLDLLLLPGPQPVRPQADHARPAVGQRLGQPGLELPAGEQLPDLQVQAQPPLPEPVGQRLDRLAVVRVVGEEGIVALRPIGRHGGTCTAEQMETSRINLSCRSSGHHHGGRAEMQRIPHSAASGPRPGPALGPGRVRRS